jgi:hypothetical protein
MTEAAVLRSCLDYLRFRGVACWRQNSGALVTPGGGFLRAADINGVADIIGLLPSGRFLAVECKSSRGRQSEAQRAFQAMVEGSGGLYLIARDIEDLKREGL